MRKQLVRLLGNLTLIRPLYLVLGPWMGRKAGMQGLLLLAAILSGLLTIALLLLLGTGGQPKWGPLMVVLVLGGGASALEFLAWKRLRQRPEDSLANLPEFASVSGLMRFWFVITAAGLVVAAAHALMVVFMMAGIALALVYYLFFGLLYLVLIVATFGAIFNDPNRPRGLGENAFEYFTYLPRSFFESEQDILAAIGLAPEVLGGVVGVVFAVLPLFVAVYTLVRIRPYPVE